MSDVVASVSPYVAKVEAWLRFVGLPYTKRTALPKQAPKGQVLPHPYKASQAPMLHCDHDPQVLVTILATVRATLSSQHAVVGMCSPLHVQDKPTRSLTGLRPQC